MIDHPKVNLSRYAAMDAGFESWVWLLAEKKKCQACRVGMCLSQMGGFTVGAAEASVCSLHETVYLGRYLHQG